MSDLGLGRARILGLLSELDTELRKVATHADVLVVGGAAMVLAYDARPATRDVDAIWHPSTEVRDAAARVAARHDDLPRDWLRSSWRGITRADPSRPRLASTWRSSSSASDWRQPCRPRS